MDLEMLYRKLLKKEITNVQVDSKKVQKNTLFFALKGKKVDGHDFLQEAVIKGASCAVVDKTYRKHLPIPLLKVENVLETLQYLAKKTLQKRKEKVIGITGSVGKTTTKEFLFQLLCNKYKVNRTKKNYNSQIGLPLAILNMRKKEIALLEMGMSEKKEMERLAQIANVDIGVITKVELVHAKNFENILEIAEEKSKIFRKKTRLKIINDDLLQYPFFEKKDCIIFSMKNKKADFFLKKEKDKILIFEEKKVILPLFLKESHFLENFLAAYVVARNLNMDISEIKERIQKIQPPKMRFEKIVKNEILFIIDCYNANEASMMAAFHNLPKVNGKKIAVLGEMQELGKFSKKAHQRVGEIAEKKVDVLLCLGKECRYMMDAFSKEKAFLKTHEEIAKYLNRILAPQDLVLLKGSRALQLEKILKKCHFYKKG